MFWGISAQLTFSLRNLLRSVQDKQLTLTCGNWMKSRLRIGDHGPVSAQVLESLLAELLALAANTESSLMNQKNCIICRQISNMMANISVKMAKGVEVQHGACFSHDDIWGSLHGGTATNCISWGHGTLAHEFVEGNRAWPQNFGWSWAAAFTLEICGSPFGWS